MAGERADSITIVPIYDTPGYAGVGSLDLERRSSRRDLNREHNVVSHDDAHHWSFWAEHQVRALYKPRIFTSPYIDPATSSLFEVVEGVPVDPFSLGPNTHIVGTYVDSVQAYGRLEISSEVLYPMADYFMNLTYPDTRTKQAFSIIEFNNSLMAIKLQDAVSRLHQNQPGTDKAYAILWSTLTQSRDVWNDREAREAIIKTSLVEILTSVNRCLRAEGQSISFEGNQKRVQAVVTFLGNTTIWTFGEKPASYEEELVRRAVKVDRFQSPTITRVAEEAAELAYAA